MAVLGEDLEPAGCIAAGDEIERTFPAGVHHLVVEARPDPRERTGGGATLVIDLAPPPAPRRH
ncbi:MAG: hypothetical protein AAGH15_14650 [Myxococcota bacterium]